MSQQAQQYNFATTVYSAIWIGLVGIVFLGQVLADVIIYVIGQRRASSAAEAAKRPAKSPAKKQQQEASKKRKATAVTAAPAAPKRPFFGAPLLHVLSQPMEKDNTIPVYIRGIIEFLETETALQQEGLFRIPGTAAEIERLGAALDTLAKNGATQLPDDFFDSAINKYHTACGLLKAYIRELPESLIPPAMFNAFCDVAKRSKEKTDDPDALAQEVNQELAKLLQQLPAHSYHLLGRVMFLFSRISQAKEATKMSGTNLAISFAMNVLKPPSDLPPEQHAILLAKTTPFINKTVELLINNSKELFVEEEVGHPGCKPEIARPKPAAEPVASDNPGAPGAAQVEDLELELGAQGTVTPDVIKDARRGLLPERVRNSPAFCLLHQFVSYHSWLAVFVPFDDRNRIGAKYGALLSLWCMAVLMALGSIIISVGIPLANPALQVSAQQHWWAAILVALGVGKPVHMCLRGALSLVAPYPTHAKHANKKHPVLYFTPKSLMILPWWFTVFFAAACLVVALGVTAAVVGIGLHMSNPNLQMPLWIVGTLVALAIEALIIDPLVFLIAKVTLTVHFFTQESLEIKVAKAKARAITRIRAI